MTDDGRLVTIDGRPALRFERRYRQPVERVWRAITDPAELASWFPANVEGDRAVGAPLVFVDDDQRAAAIEAGEPTLDDGPPLRGVVVAFNPPKVFSFTWGGELLRFELLADDGGTRLVFTQLLSGQSVAARNGAGWHACLAELERTLDESAPGAPEDWMAVYEGYLERVGPSLGTPSGGGSITWERSTHVTPTRVREATTDATERTAWGGDERADDDVRWDVEPTEHGAVYRLTVAGLADDPEAAATWHALLVQLDMYLAAGQLVPVDPGRWVEPYRAALQPADR